MTHINLFKLPLGNRQFNLIYNVKKLISKYKRWYKVQTPRGALSIYTGGGVPRHIQKGGLRHGHNQKRGVLGTGTSRKKGGGVLGTGMSRKMGVLGTGTSRKRGGGS